MNSHASTSTDNSPLPNAPMLAIRSGAKSFTLHLHRRESDQPVELRILDGLNLDVHAGECVALVGPSGAGKSSILKMIFGTYRASAGAIWVNVLGNRAEPSDLSLTADNPTLRDAPGWLNLATAPPRLVSRVRLHSLDTSVNSFVWSHGSLRSISSQSQL